MNRYKKIAVRALCLLTICANAFLYSAQDSPDFAPGNTETNIADLFGRQQNNYDNPEISDNLDVLGFEPDNTTSLDYLLGMAELTHKPNSIPVDMPLSVYETKQTMPHVIAAACHIVNPTPKEHIKNPDNYTMQPKRKRKAADLEGHASAKKQRTTQAKKSQSKYVQPHAKPAQLDTTRERNFKCTTPGCPYAAYREIDLSTHIIKIHDPGFAIMDISNHTRTQLLCRAPNCTYAANTPTNIQQHKKAGLHIDTHTPAPAVLSKKTPVQAMPFTHVAPPTPLENIQTTAIFHEIPQPLAVNLIYNPKTGFYHDPIHDIWYDPTNISANGSANNTMFYLEADQLKCLPKR